MLNLTMLIISLVVGIIVGAVVLTQLTPIAGTFAQCYQNDTVGTPTIGDAIPPYEIAVVHNLVDNSPLGGNLKVTMKFNGTVPANPDVALSYAPSTYSITSATSDSTLKEVYVNIHYEGSDDAFDVNLANAPSQSHMIAVSNVITTNSGENDIYNTLRDACNLFISLGGAIVIIGVIVGIVVYLRFFQ